MKKPNLFLSVLLLASLSITGVAAHSQTNAAPNALSKRKKVVKYNESTNEVVEVSPQESSSPVYIVNSPKYESAAPQQKLAATEPSVQEQPSTLIEASSLKESKADSLRKSRQDMEVQTEQKIVEKLEEARIQDEKARAERLFGASLAAPLIPAPSPTPAPAPMLAPPPQAPQAQQQPPIVIVQKQEVDEEQPQKVSAEDDKASIKDEVKKALDEAKNDQGEPKATYYIGGLVGVSEYPDASNVRGTGSGGFAIGTTTADGWVAEGTFVYSTYDLLDYTQSNPFKTVTQYNFTVGAKYQFLTGKLRPNVGVVGAYANRKYANKQSYYSGSDDVKTNSLDAGLSAGIDLMITKAFSLGIDFRYFTNVAYNTNSNYQQAFQGSQFGTPLEKLDYYTATLAGKVTF